MLSEKKNLLNLEKARKIRTALARQKQRRLHQTGKIISLARDMKRKSLPPGYRVSKNGKVYYEARANRSDLPGQRT